MADRQIKDIIASMISVVNIDEGKPHISENEELLTSSHFSGMDILRDS